MVTFRSTVGVLPSVPGGLGGAKASGYPCDGFPSFNIWSSSLDFCDDLIWCVQRGPT